MISEAQARTVAGRWNDAHPVGTLMVYAHSGSRRPERVKTRSEARALASGAVIVQLEGKPGSYRIEQLRRSVRESAEPLPLLDQVREQLRTQDNLGAAEPIYVVEQIKREYGYSDVDWRPEYRPDGVEWVDTSNDGCSPESPDEEEMLEDVYAHHANFAEELRRMGHSDGWVRLGYKNHWEFVQPFLTMTGAQLYIEMNDLGECRVQVHSANSNPEWCAVRKLLTGDV